MKLPLGMGRIPKGKGYCLTPEGAKFIEEAVDSAVYYAESGTEEEVNRAKWVNKETKLIAELLSDLTKEGPKFTYHSRMFPFLYIRKLLKAGFITEDTEVDWRGQVEDIMNGYVDKEEEAFRMHLEPPSDLDDWRGNG